MCQSVIFGSLTLRKARALNFGVKFNFSKIRMEPVMHDFLAITEKPKKRIQNDRITIAGKLSDKKNKWEIAIRNFHHSEQE